MAEKVGSIYYDLDLDDDKFNSKIKKTESRFEKAKGSSQLLLGAIVGVGAGMVVAGKQALTSAGNFETMGVALETAFQGDKKAAKEAQDQITKFASTTPYQLEEVMTGFIKLKNMGLDPSQRAMTSYGDTASAMGKGLNEMVEAVADAATGEFERLKEFGIRASSEGDRVKFTFKGVTTEVGKNSKEIEDYLINLGETNFSGGMEKQSLTLNGLISTLKDNFSLAMAQIAKDSGLLDIAKKAIIFLAEKIEKFRAKVDEAGGFVQYFLGVFERNKTTIYIIAGAIAFALIPAFIGLATAMWAAVAPLLPFIAIGALLGLGIKKLIDKFGGLKVVLEKVRPALDWIKEAFEKVKSIIELFVTGNFNMRIAKSLGVGEDDPIVDKILTFRDTVIGLKDKLIEFGMIIWNWLKPKLLFIWEWLSVNAIPITKDIINRLIEFSKKAWEIAKMVWEFLWPSLQQLWDTIKTQLLPALKNLWDSFMALWEVLWPILKPVLKWIAIIIGAVIVAAVWVLINAIRVIVSVVSWFADKFAGAMNVLRKYIKFVQDRWEVFKVAFAIAIAYIRYKIDEFKSKFAEIKDKIHSVLSGVAEAIKKPFREAFNWLKDKVNDAKNALSKLNPFHRESPSLVDWITRGTHEITGLYDDMFNQLDRKTAEARTGLVASAEISANNADELSGNQTMAGQTNNITLQMDGIMARSRNDIREIFKDGIRAVNEDLQARGQSTINI